ncbi:MAG: nucleotidyltransferase domain-containing protein [Proteobacteria bacterium]|nr:nucleotidyltransferase domain-containing protein [Pseudomonadota bacterium]
MDISEPQKRAHSPLLAAGLASESKNSKPPYVAAKHCRQAEHSLQLAAGSFKSIKTTFYVREIGIFGSFVKGEQKTKSDIDILVVFEQGHKDFFNYMRLNRKSERIPRCLRRG